MNKLILLMWGLSLTGVVIGGISVAVSFVVSLIRHRKSLISMEFVAGACILNILFAPFILIERMFPDTIFITATTIFVLIVLATITCMFLLLKSQNSRNSDSSQQ
ncbi:hypothetical protein HYT26_01500 [Candidatus Pacearchaeota archaeon]|nr:hypothetical protein [Candidatus Pacearchaeota archaeon]